MPKTLIWYPRANVNSQTYPSGPRIMGVRKPRYMGCVVGKAALVFTLGIGNCLDHAFYALAIETRLG